MSLQQKEKTKMSALPGYLTVKEATKKFGLNTFEVYFAVKHGIVKPAGKVGKTILFLADDGATFAPLLKNGKNGKK